jgi:hypothetical protein
MYAARRIGSGLGKPGPDFLIGLEQHPEIDRYVAEFLDDHRVAKHADIVCRSAISNSTDVACRVADGVFVLTLKQIEDHGFRRAWRSSRLECRRNKCASSLGDLRSGAPPPLFALAVSPALRS